LSAKLIPSSLSPHGAKPALVMTHPSPADIGSQGYLDNKSLGAVVVDGHLLKRYQAGIWNVVEPDLVASQSDSGRTSCSISGVQQAWRRMRSDLATAAIAPLSGIKISSSQLDGEVHFSDVIRFLNPDVLIFCYETVKCERFIVLWQKLLREAFICGRGYNSVKPVLLIRSDLCDTDYTKIDWNAVAKLKSSMADTLPLFEWNDHEWKEIPYGHVDDQLSSSTNGSATNLDFKFAQMVRVYLGQGGLPKSTAEVYTKPEPTFSGQYRYRVSEPFIPRTALQNVASAVESRVISSSSHLPLLVHKNLISLYDGAISHAQTVANGFDALVVGLRSLGIGIGDEVLIPSMTFIAVLNAVLAVNATPILVDNAYSNYNPSIRDWEGALTQKTRAIIIAYPFGLLPHEHSNPLRLAEWCRSKCLYMLEDISEAFGCRYDGNLLGCFGDLGCCSLFANKLITCGDGGFVVTKDPLLGQRLPSMVAHGGTFGCGTYRFVHAEAGPNCKMSGLASAFIAPAIPEVPRLAENRRLVCQWYEEALKDVFKSFDEPPVALMPISESWPTRELGIGNDIDELGKFENIFEGARTRDFSTVRDVTKAKAGSYEVPWLTGVHCKNAQTRDALRQHLADRGIETRSYFLPIHLQPSYRQWYSANVMSEDIRRRGSCGSIDDLPHANSLGATGLNLPTYSQLERDDINTIVACIASFFESQGSEVNVRTKLLETPLGTKAPNFISFDESTAKAGGLDESATVSEIRSRSLSPVNFPDVILQSRR